MRGLGRDPGQWRKSSYSNPEPRDCVEAVLGPERIGIRDSTRPEGTALDLPNREWTAQLRAVHSR